MPCLLIGYDSEWENLESGREMLSWQYAFVDGEDLVEICAEKEGGWPSANYYDNKEDVFHHYDEEEGAFPLHMYPCQKVTKEDYKNGYVVLFGLPEGKFQALVSGWWSYEKYFPQIVVKP